MTTQWFKCENSTPELLLSISNGFMWESQYVLVYSKKYGIQKCAYYASEGKQKFWWWTTRHGQEITEVTHWMFLQEKPQEN